MIDYDALADEIIALKRVRSLDFLTARNIVFAKHPELRDDLYGHMSRIGQVCGRRSGRRRRLHAIRRDIAATIESYDHVPFSQLICYCGDEPANDDRYLVHSMDEERRE